MAGSFVTSICFSHSVSFCPSVLLWCLTFVASFFLFHQEASCILYFPSNSKAVSDLSLLPSSNPMRMQSHPPLHGALCPFSHSKFLFFFSLHPSQMNSWVTSACAIYWSASSVYTGKRENCLVIILPPDLYCNKQNCGENMPIVYKFFQFFSDHQ